MNDHPEQPLTPFAARPETAAAGQPVVQVVAGSQRLPLWILLSVLLGFMLPVCACAVLGVAFAGSLGAMAAGGATAGSVGSGPAVAVVRVSGTIVSSDEDEFAAEATSGVVIADLRAAAEDPDVKAIVLRVDSPGGSVTGSAQIYEAVKELDKPVVVSMAATAASGGYYISAPADYIFARPDTTTGSIGVILTLFNAEQLAEELGIEVITLTAGENKAIGGLWDALTPEQADILTAFIDEAYETFVRVIADGRGLDLDTVRALADGRIYSGRQALDLGLVDELGDLREAIAKAADLGGISGEPRIVEYERLPGLEQLLLGFSTRLTQSQTDELMALLGDLAAPRIEYRYAGLGGQ